MSRTRAAAAERATAGRDRKAEHIRIALDARTQLGENYLERYRFEHCALPEVGFEDIDVSRTFLGVKLAAPLLISCMTGGTGDASRINRNLARAAERTRIAVGVGSQRKALEDPATAASFRIRPFAPSMPILANLLVEAKDDRLLVGASDLEVTIRGSAKATVTKSGSVTLPAGKLHEIARSLPESEVKFKLLDRNVVAITCERTNYKIAGQGRDEFPNFPEVTRAADELLGGWDTARHGRLGHGALA